MMYLHAPDPIVPIEDSAMAISEICKRGWARYAAVSNVDLEQATRFAAVCPVVAIQPYFNMFQPEVVRELLPFVLPNNISLVCYWVLMKGLLSGRLKRDHVFDPTDRRLSYPIYQGQAWEDAQNLLDKLRYFATELDCTVTQLVIAWSLTRSGISVALVGAKRPDQINDSVQAMHMKLDDDVIEKINAIVSC